MTGRDRVQTDAFQAFRGIRLRRRSVRRRRALGRDGRQVCAQSRVPAAVVASWAALNALIITDLATRSARHREAWTLERRHLRALPVHLPETCRVEARVVDKFGHVRADRVTYSVPTRYAYRPVWVKRITTVSVAPRSSPDT